MFVYGYMIAGSPEINLAIDRALNLSLGLGLLCMALVLGINCALWQGIISFDFFPPTYCFLFALRGFNVWLWLIILLGLGRKFLNRPGSFLTYANDASLPFYILHQTVLVAIGFYVVRWPVANAVKYLVITTLALIGTVASCEILVKRTKITRFLFGMK